MIKFINTLKQFVYLDFKNTYFRGYFYLYEFLSVFLTVLVYYYSSKAFVPDQNSGLNFFGMDFFTYLLWGDLLLRIPQSLFYTPVKKIKQSIQDNTFESMILFNGSAKMVVFSLSTMELLRELIYFGMTILCAFLFFGFSFDSMNLFGVLMISLAYFPLFLGIGFGLSGFVLYFEKGENVLSSLSSILAVMAGLYFPIEVFPGFLQRLSAFISPYSYFLRASRMAISGQFTEWLMILLIFILGVVFAWLSLHFVTAVINRKKIKGESLIIT